MMIPTLRVALAGLLVSTPALFATTASAAPPADCRCGDEGHDDDGDKDDSFRLCGDEGHDDDGDKDDAFRL